MTTKAARNTLVGFLGATITGTVGAFIGLKLQNLQQEQEDIKQNENFKKIIQIL